MGAPEEVIWMARKVGGSHRGTINISGGYFSVRDGQITEGEIEMDMHSIEVTDIEDPEDKLKLEKHLRSADFFNAEEYPNAKLIIGNVTGYGQERLLHGAMMIKGITNETINDL